MVNIMFCVFSIILKLWTQMDQQMRKQCCLAEKFSVLDSVADAQKMQMHKAQHHNPAGDGLGLGVCITVGFFTRGQGCENRFHSTTCKWVTRATLE